MIKGRVEIIKSAVYRFDHQSRGSSCLCSVALNTVRIYNNYCIYIQEAQLSQRDRTSFVSLNILLSHSWSLKVIHNDTIE